MLLYEVNLTVDDDVAGTFETWLREHIREMLKLDGFEAAAWYTRHDAVPAAEDEAPATNPRRWTIHYEVDGPEALQAYLDEHADRMRQDGIDRFDGQFSAERRILTQKRIFSRHNPDRQSPGR